MFQVAMWAGELHFWCWSGMPSMLSEVSILAFVYALSCCCVHQEGVEAWCHKRQR
jgi:hypothetical protein